jgi:calcium/calmodulin-dependent 3',5'-cyclic nucleotide phosphodiesterase
MSSSGKHINSPEQLLDFIKEKFSNLNQITKENILNFRKDLESSLSPNLAININYLIEELTQVIKTKANPKQFIEAISSKNIINKSISTIKKDISTRGEKVDSILKELKTAAENANDKESVNDLEWIIQKLHEGDIYEINENFMENEHFKTEINKEGVDYMIQYSKIENDLQKSKDYSAVRKNNLNNKANNNEGKNTDEKSGNINTRSEPNFIIKKLNPELSIKITNILSKIDSPDFDIFSLDSLTDAKGSLFVAEEIIDRLDIVKSEIIERDILKNFLTEIVENYSRENAYYHNDLHAADVMQTLYTMLIKGNLKAKMKLDDLSKFAIIIGALGHDLKHPGQNNMFHITTRSKIAIRYNDKSVLENYHIANIFKIAKEDKYNIFKPFRPEEYRIMRRRIVEGILATDMKKHQKVIGKIKNRAEVYSIKNGKNFNKMFNETDANKLFDAQQEVLNMLIHSADISNPAKPSKISQQWTDKVYEEFFRQGDLEKKLEIPISMMCDRLTTNVNQAMIGFISFVVMPTIDILFNFLPEIPEYSKNIHENLKKHQLEFSKDEQAKKLKEEKMSHNNNN